MHKVFSLIIILSFVGNISYAVSEKDELLSQATNSPAISKLIAENFLIARKKKLNEEEVSISTANSKKENNSTSKKAVEKRIFGSKGYDNSASMHNIHMNIIKERNEFEDFVIIETVVFGTRDDFENRNILPVESKLLKNILIQNYLTKREEMAKSTWPRLINVVPLDTNTKSIKSPHTISSLLSPKDTSESDRERMRMEFVTIFPKKEFDVFVQKHFEVNNNE